MPNPLFKSIKFRAFLFFISALLVSSCSNLNIKQIPSGNHNDRIRFLVMHHTTIDYQESVEALTRKDNVSAHYLIPESNDPSYQQGSLQTVQLVSEADRAWHAGVSHWQGENGLNDQSIGIELVYKSPCVEEENPLLEDQSGMLNSAKAPLMEESGLNIHAASDRICFYPNFDEKQIELLIELTKDILKRNPEITPDRIIAHADIAPDRRIDPGPKFPWHRLYKEGIGAWYDDETVSKYWQQFHKKPATISLVQAALRNYGYGILETGVMDSQTINSLTVFQMHFRPWQVDGQINAETTATLFALIEKYRENRLEKLLARYQTESFEMQFTEKEIVKGQFKGLFVGEEFKPQDEYNQKSNKRAFVSNRQIFKGYQGQGKLKIISKGASSADIYINGKKLPSIKGMVLDSKREFNLKTFTKDGYNTIRVENISPKVSSIEVYVPFPKLVQGKASKEGLSNKKLTKIDQLIKQEIEKGFPGATLLIAKNGKIIKNTAYGYSYRYNEQGEEVSSPQKMNKDTLFDMASNTKMYAANFALMKLVSENKIDVNLPIMNYLKEYKDEGRESRLVRDLLTHTAGYPPEILFHDKNNQYGEHFFSNNKTYTQNLLIQKVPFSYGRNIKSVYSDIDYMLLGTLIERVTGMALDEYVEQQIYIPLGLTKTLFNPLQKQFKTAQIAATELQGNTRQSTIDFDNVRRQVIHGEVHDEKAFYSMGGVSGHAGLFSTAKETAILASVILNRGGYGDVKLFDKSQMDHFLKPSELNITMGLGWRRAANGERAWQFGPYASPYAIGHTGWTGTVTVIDPFHDLIIVLLTNRKHSPMVERCEDSDCKLVFTGDEFETGKYGSIISLIYEAFLEN